MDNAYRQPHTGGLSWPAWEDDPDFDLKRHIGHAALPAPGGERELSEWSSQFFSQRLDRHRPLWEMTLLEGLSGGRWALATKTHHCMVDGVGSVDVGHVLLDVAPEGDSGAPGEGDGEPSAAAEPFAAAGQVRRRAPTHAPGPQQRFGSRFERAREGLEGFAPLTAAAHAARLGAHGALHPREGAFECPGDGRSARAGGASWRAEHEPERAHRDTTALRGRADTAG